MLLLSTSRHLLTQICFAMFIRKSLNNYVLLQKCPCRPLGCFSFQCPAGERISWREWKRTWSRWFQWPGGGPGEGHHGGMHDADSVNITCESEIGFSCDLLRDEEEEEGVFVCRTNTNHMTGLNNSFPVHSNRQSLGE
jgi:hypothetical protein